MKLWWLPVQSVTADFYSEEDRGKVFGTLHLTSAAGAAFGGLYATNMGELLGLPGIRAPWTAFCYARLSNRPLHCTRPAIRSATPGLGDACARMAAHLDSGKMILDERV